MPRNRSLPHTVFSDDKLAMLPFEARWLLLGLATIADREGRLEDRPARIKAAILPYDDVDTDGILTLLDSRGHIARWVSNGVAIIEIMSFSERYAPHYKEAESQLPAYVGDFNVESTLTQRRVNVNSTLTQRHLNVEKVNVPTLALADESSKESDDRVLVERTQSEEEKIREEELREDKIREESQDKSIAFPTEHQNVLPGMLVPKSPNSKNADDKSQDADTAEGEFNAFWKLYPRKDGKAKAKIAWMRLKASERALALIAVVDQQRPGGTLDVASKRLPDGSTVILHPTTWLHGKRWEDEGLKPPTNLPPFTASESEAETPDSIMRRLCGYDGELRITSKPKPGKKGWQHIALD